MATLAPRAGMRAAVPPLRERPVLRMADMGMGHGDQIMPDSPAWIIPAWRDGPIEHARHGYRADGARWPARPHPPRRWMDHGAMNMRDKSKVSFPVGVGVDMIAPMPTDRTGHPGIGLENVGHRVLTYRDLVALKPYHDQRQPTRRIDIHLTGNMERFMWSMDGKKLSEAPEPYRLARNERVRMRLINDTMMTHPMHIHGHFWQIVNGHGEQPAAEAHHPCPAGRLCRPGHDRGRARRLGVPLPPALSHARGDDAHRESAAAGGRTGMKRLLILLAAIGARDARRPSLSMRATPCPA